MAANTNHSEYVWSAMNYLDIDDNSTFNISSFWDFYHNMNCTKLEDDPSYMEHLKYKRIYGISLYVIIPICVLGIIGNILSFLVLGKDTLGHQTHTIFLQYLAAGDGLYLLLYMFYALVAYFESGGQTYALTILKAYLKQIVQSAHDVAVWLLVPVTIFRYIAVCKPQKAVYLTIEKAKQLAWVVIVVVILADIPLFIEFSVVKSHNRFYCNSYYEVLSMHFSPLVSMTYRCVFFILMYAVPLCILAFLNAKLILTVRESRRRHAQLRGREVDQDVGITIVLISVVSILIICQTPMFVSELLFFLHNYHRGDFLYMPWDQTLIIVQVTQVLALINSSVNFIIYYARGKGFRTILIDIIKGRHDTNNRIRSGSKISETFV